MKLHGMPSLFFLRGSHPAGVRGLKLLGHFHNPSVIKSRTPQGCVD